MPQSFSPFRRTSRTPHPTHGAVVCATAVLAMAAPLLAQETATLAGVVRDGTSGQAIPGATVSVTEEGRRTVTDSLGAFRLSNVPLGPRLLLVQGFGYEDLLVPVNVTPSTASVDVRLEPSPIAIEGIEVTGEAQKSLTGVVLDASSGEGIAWAALWLRDHGRGASNELGAFRLGRVPPGSYLLLVQRMGYVSLYIPVRVGAHPDPIIVRLEPDPIVLEGITAVNSRFKGRRNAYPRAVRAYDEDRLRRSGSADVLRFLQFDAFLNFTVCPRIGTGLCVISRGRPISPRVYVDEAPVFCGLDMLQSYHPSELYLVEVYGGGEQIRVYTHDHVERQARRPRATLPADLPAPGLPAC